MNDIEEKAVDSYRSLLLMSEIAKEEPVSQRELAQRLGIALGLVNSYLRNLVAKGYVRIKTFPRNRYAYLLTPQGIAEKSRLAYRHIGYFTNLYIMTRQDFRALFMSLKSAGVTRVIFCGVDEVAEIAYLSLREAGIRLAGIVDDERVGEDFFDGKIMSLDTVRGIEDGVIIITSLKRGEHLGNELARLGVDGKRIRTAGSRLPTIDGHNGG